MRPGNEDTLVDRPDALLWAVADGAGGHEHGEVASAALKAALEATSGEAADLVADVRLRVAAVHDALRLQAGEEQAATGLPVTIASTLVVLLGHGAHYACLWCGDSRAYLLRGGVLSALTRDHSLVQEMVDAGALDPALAEQHPHANVLTRAIGAEGSAELDKVSGMAAPGDRFLLCSDGVFKVLNADAIAGLIGGAEPARTLIDAALAASARDNVTAVVVEPLFPDAPGLFPEAPGDDDTLMVRG